MASRPDSYDPDFFASLFAVEDQHFWFRARNRIIGTLVRQTVASWERGYQVLEVGCGTGKVLSALEKACQDGKIVGMDLFAEGLKYAAQRVGCALLQGDLHTPPFNTEFDLIGLFDVLEHLPDDVQVLDNLYTMLAPGGVLLLTVPAHPSLWSYFDEDSCHCRRYSLDDLKSKLIHIGYTIDYITHYMATIFPLVWLKRRLAVFNFRRSEDGKSHIQELVANEFRIIPIVNEILNWLLTQEGRLLSRRCRLFIGTSLITIARKPDF